MNKNSLLLLFIVLLLLGSCSKKDNPVLSVEEVVAQKLELTTWKLGNVQVDGVDRSSLFNGFTIKFNSTNYTTTGTTTVWARSGTWQFNANSNALKFTRNDSIVVTIESITDSSLVLSLMWNESTFGGRINSVAGKHIFTLTK